MPYDAPAANVTSNSAIVIRLLLGFFDAVGRQTEERRARRSRSSGTMYMWSLWEIRMFVIFWVILKIDNRRRPKLISREKRFHECQDGERHKVFGYFAKV